MTLVAGTVTVLLCLTFCVSVTTVRVNGNWGGWSALGVCSRTCGGGMQWRIRVCNNPAPTNGGWSCVGNGVDARVCATAACKHVPVPAGNHENINSGTCTSVSKEDCDKIAKQRGKYGAIDMADRFKSIRPPGCYHRQVDNVVWYNDNLSSTQLCTQTRVCICKKLVVEDIRSGTCRIISKDDCDKIAKQRGRYGARDMALRFKSIRPPGCYQKQDDHEVWYNDNILSTRTCTPMRVCICSKRSSPIPATTPGPNPTEHCPEERGYCLSYTGVAQTTVARIISPNKKDCLSACRGVPTATGCVYVGVGNICAVHTLPVVSGSGAAGSSCWVLSKCKKV